MMSRARRNPLATAAVLLAGAAVVGTLGTTRKKLPEIVIALGVTLVLAWVLDRGRRFGGSGFVLSGLGLGLTLSDHVGSGAYRDECIFLGIGVGFFFVARLLPAAVGGAALALAAVAAFEAMLTYLPGVVALPTLYRAFGDGWGFALVLVLDALWVLGGARRS